MQGINVLNQTEIMEYSSFHIGIMIVSLVGLILGVIIVHILDNKRCDPLAILISGVISLIVGIVLIVSIIISPTEHTGRYKYECTIEEFVSIQDIYDSYEVIEQHGELWILEDKE